ncbi:hypothetical protein PENTCL1PPCAC_3052, partial [Pristionchus entomophagus]
AEMSDQEDDGIQELRRRTDPDGPDKDFENFLSAHKGAGELAIQSARYLELEMTYGDLAERFNSLDAQKEEAHRQYTEEKVLCERAQSSADGLQSDVVRQQEEIAVLKAAAKKSKKIVADLNAWRMKAATSEEAMVNMLKENEAHVKRIEDVTNLLKLTLKDSATHEANATSLAEQLKQKANEMKALIRHGDPVVRLLADISRGNCELDEIRARANAIPIDELIAILRPYGGDSDDDDAEVDQRAMNAGAGSSSGATRDRRGRGGRGGRSQSLAFDVNVTSHDNLPARKLNRNDDEPEEAAPSKPAAKSVIGRATETEQEQRERQREEKMAELRRAEWEQEEREREALRRACNAHYLPRPPAEDDDIQILADTVDPALNPGNWPEFLAVLDQPDLDSDEVEPEVAAPAAAADDDEEDTRRKKVESKRVENGQLMADLELSDSDDEEKKESHDKEEKKMAVEEDEEKEEEEPEEVMGEEEMQKRNPPDVITIDDDVDEKREEKEMEEEKGMEEEKKGDQPEESMEKEKEDEEKVEIVVDEEEETEKKEEEEKREEKDEEAVEDAMEVDTAGEKEEDKKEEMEEEGEKEEEVKEQEEEVTENEEEEEKEKEEEEKEKEE